MRSLPSSGCPLQTGVPSPARKDVFSFWATWPSFLALSFSPMGGVCFLGSWSSSSGTESPFDGHVDGCGCMGFSGPCPGSGDTALSASGEARDCWAGDGTRVSGSGAPRRTQSASASGGVPGRWHLSSGRLSGTVLGGHARGQRAGGRPARKACSDRSLEAT